MTNISDKAWHVWVFTKQGKRVLTGIVEDDAELVARLKTMAEELHLNVEISPVEAVSDTPLKIPESWKQKPKR